MSPTSPRTRAPAESAVAAATIAARRHGRTSAAGAIAIAAAESQNPISAFEAALEPPAATTARNRATMPATEAIESQSVRSPIRLNARPATTSATATHAKPSVETVIWFVAPFATGTE